MVRKVILNKGFFFSIDALIAVILILSVLVMVPVFYMKEEQTTQPVYFSSDIVQLLSTMKIGEISNPSVVALINSSNITDMNRTILEQTLRFQVAGYEDKAQELLALTMGDLIPDYYNIGIWMEGYSTPIYTTSQEPVTQLVSSKQMVSGIERGRAIEGLSARAFLTGIDEGVSSKYVYFGGYEGDGNITKKFKLPSNIDVLSAYMELDINDNFNFYINKIFVDSFTPQNLNASIDFWDIENTTLFHAGNNTIEFRFNSTSTRRYIGGGYFKVSYNTPNILLMPNETLYQFPGIKGIINLYDSFYVPGILQSIKAHLHFYNKYNIFFNIGNETVYRNMDCDGEYIIDLYDSNFSSLDYSSLSQKTVPIRLGTEAFELIKIAYNADVVLITDLSGSMRWRLDSSNQGVTRNCDDPLLYDPSTRRISLAKCLDKEFVNTIMDATGNKMGLVGFSSSAHTYTPNLDYTKEQLISHIEEYPDSPSGGTCICCAINKAYDIFSNALYSMAILVPKKSSWLYNPSYPLTIPPKDQNDNNWTSINYNDSGWSSGNTILGFEKTYSPYVDTNISINSVVLSNNSYNASDYFLINYSVIAGDLADTYFVDGNTFDIVYAPNTSDSSTIFYDGFEDYYGDGAHRIDGNDINRAPGYWYIDDTGEEVYLMANYNNYPAYSGTDVLVFRDMDSYGYAETTIDLSLYSNPKLSYWWRLGPNRFDSGEYADVRVWDGSWHTLVTYNSDDTDDTYHYAEIDLSPYSKVSNFKIRFGAKSSWDNERFYVDEVAIKEEPLPQPPEIWFNSTALSYSEEFDRVSAKLIFKSNSSANYAMLIYNFNANNWESNGCDSEKVIANVWNDFWCSKTNPSDYISADDKIRVGLITLASDQTVDGFEDGNIDDWSTGGNAEWYATNSMSYNGDWSARAGPITHDEESWIEKALEGPLTLNFYWKVSSEQNYDYLRFYIDDSEESSISGEVDWQQKTYDIPSGTHTIKWKYTKDGSVTYGSDTGWIDDITITQSAPKAFTTNIDFVQYYTTKIRGDYYFRKHFEINNKDTFLSARLYVLSDDRADIYLNGYLVDNDTVDHNAEYWNRYKDINTSYLNEGNNVFAVKLHNKDDRSAKFDLQLEVNSSRQRYIIVMSDGITGYHCGDCAPDCSGSCTSTTGSSECGGGSSDCTGSQCDTAINDAICSSCRAYNELNSTVYSIGFGPISDCYNANKTLEGIAACGHASYYTSSDADELKGIYIQIAESILNATYEAQFINLSGMDILPSVLYPDSYIKLEYTPTSTEPVYGLIPLTIESERFGNAITEGSFYVPDNVVIYDAKLTSYSGDKWTATTSIKDSSNNWITFYNLSEYSMNYWQLGDPYLINIPTDLVLKNRDNIVMISTAINPLNATGGSPDDRAIYTIGIDIDINYTGIFEKAEGCSWFILFEDDTNKTMPIPSTYSGDKNCNFDETTDCNSYNNDAINNVVCHLFKQLDFDNDGKLFVKFGPEDLDVDIYSIGRIPYMWGPTMVEVRVWK